MLLVLEELGLLTAAEVASVIDHFVLRGLLALLASLAVALVLGPPLIRWLGIWAREPNKSDSPTLRALHAPKHATPTMGGLLIVGSFVASALLFGQWEDATIVTALFLVVGLAILGAIDDLAKIRSARSGITRRQKLCGQFLIALAGAVVLYLAQRHDPGAYVRRVPLTVWTFDLGTLFIPVAALVIVASSNAVNLTDGLDGLASGCVAFTTLGIALAAWAVHATNPTTPGPSSALAAREVVVLAGATLGAVLGFLWFNRWPASVFMGDTGSLPLGGLLGLLAICARQELLLLLVGAVLVAEAASVILQVGYYRWSRKRIFRCAPLHHHFQFKGWSERTIVRRFWIASAVAAAAGLLVVGAQLKLDRATSLQTALRSIQP